MKGSLCAFINTYHFLHHNFITQQLEEEEAKYIDIKLLFNFARERNSRNYKEQIIGIANKSLHRWKELQREMKIKNGTVNSIENSQKARRKKKDKENLEGVTYEKI